MFKENELVATNFSALSMRLMTSISFADTPFAIAIKGLDSFYGKTLNEVKDLGLICVSDPYFSKQSKAVLDGKTNMNKVIETIPWDKYTLGIKENGSIGLKTLSENNDIQTLKNGETPAVFTMLYTEKFVVKILLDLRKNVVFWGHNTYGDKNPQKIKLSNKCPLEFLSTAIIAINALAKSSLKTVKEYQKVMQAIRKKYPETTATIAYNQQGALTILLMYPITDKLAGRTTVETNRVPTKEIVDVIGTVLPNRKLGFLQQLMEASEESAIQQMPSKNVDDFEISDSDTPLDLEEFDFVDNNSNGNTDFEF